jgi:hypothetical protein
MELVRRLFTAPKESYFLFGPRGTGKSTWLRWNYPEAVYIDLLDQEVFRKYLAGPERLGDAISGSRQAKAVIVDDIQADFKGDNAKLIWPVSVDGKKMQSETYKVLGIFGKAK